MPNNFEKKRTMKGLNATQEIFFMIVDFRLVDLVNNLMKCNKSNHSKQRENDAIAVSDL